MGSVVEALVKAVEKFGGEVCTKVKVDEAWFLSGETRASVWRNLCFCRVNLVNRWTETRLR